MFDVQSRPKDFMKGESLFYSPNNSLCPVNVLYKILTQFSRLSNYLNWCNLPPYIICSFYSSLHSFSLKLKFCFMIDDIIRYVYKNNVIFL
jgi:hypothetical protein